MLKKESEFSLWTLFSLLFVVPVILVIGGFIVMFEVTRELFRFRKA